MDMAQAQTSNIERLRENGLFYEWFLLYPSLAPHFVTIARILQEIDDGWDGLTKNQVLALAVITMWDRVSEEKRNNPVVGEDRFEVPCGVPTFDHLVKYATLEWVVGAFHRYLRNHDIKCYRIRGTSTYRFSHGNAYIDVSESEDGNPNFSLGSIRFDEGTPVDSYCRIFNQVSEELAYR